MRIAFAWMVLVSCLGCQSSTASFLDCRFVPMQAPEDELEKCASVEEGESLVLEPKLISAVRARDHEPVAVVIGSTLYYANREGRVAPVLWYDNGPDYFAEGLARTSRGGKVGFIDRELIERIPPSWDFAFPFQGGVALVCQGCRPQSVDEHRELRGGMWGYIDRDGAEVVPVRFERDDLPAPPSR